MIHQLSFTHLFTRFYVNIVSVEAEQIDSSPLPLNFLIHLVVTITLGSVMLQLKVFVYSFISLFTYLFIHLFIYIFTHSFIYLFIYLTHFDFASRIALQYCNLIKVKIM